jgi:hypothetical protein
MLKISKVSGKKTAVRVTWRLGFVQRCVKETFLSASLIYLMKLSITQII